MRIQKIAPTISMPGFRPVSCSSRNDTAEPATQAFRTMGEPQLERNCLFFLSTFYSTATKKKFNCFVDKRIQNQQECGL